MTDNERIIEVIDYAEYVPREEPLEKELPDG
jgi:hypothetical protein